MVAVFKTNILRNADANRITELFQQLFPTWKCNFDLEDCDKVFRVEADCDTSTKVIVLFAEMNFQCEPLD
jgi:hypothetical protein